MPIEWAPGVSDSVVADSSWEGYQRRNAGAIADIFAGQFRSQVECNQCQVCVGGRGAYDPS